MSEFFKSHQETKEKGENSFLKKIPESMQNKIILGAALLLFGSISAYKIEEGNHSDKLRENAEELKKNNPIYPKKISAYNFSYDITVPDNITKVVQKNLDNTTGYNENTIREYKVENGEFKFNSWANGNPLMEVFTKDSEGNPVSQGYLILEANPNKDTTEVGPASLKDSKAQEGKIDN